MKKYNYVFCLLLAVTLFFMPNGAVFAKELEISGGERLEELCEETMSVSEVSTTVMDLEYENNMRALYLDSVMKARSTYSKYYGGCYLNNGELVVKLTDTEKEIVSYFDEAVHGSANYEKCSVSLDELTAIRALIKDYIVNNKNSENDVVNGLIDSVVCLATDIKNNAVSVTIKNCTEEKIALFKQLVINSEHVLFETTEGYVDDVIYVKPGERINIVVNGVQKIYSMGFRCKKLKSDGTYAKGFVTAAHGEHGIGNLVYTTSGNLLGRVSARSYFNGGKVDAVFVEVSNSNCDCSNTVYSNGTVLTGGVAPLSVGSSVSKFGYATSLTSGKVTKTNAELLDTEKGINTIDLYETDYYSLGGDSGCILFDPNSKLVVGIHKGRMITSSINKAYAVKAANIRSALNVSLY